MKTTINSIVEDMYNYESSDMAGDNRKNIIKLLKQIENEIQAGAESEEDKDGFIYLKVLSSEVTNIFKKYYEE